MEGKTGSIRNIQSKIDTIAERRLWITSSKILFSTILEIVRGSRGMEVARSILYIETSIFQHCGISELSIRYPNILRSNRESADWYGDRYYTSKIRYFNTAVYRNFRYDI